MDLTSEPIFISASLQDQVIGQYGPPLAVSLPEVTPTGNHAAAFEALLRQIGRNLSGAQVKEGVEITGPDVGEQDGLDLVPPLLDPVVCLTVNGIELETADVLNGLNTFLLPRRCTDGQSSLSIAVHVEPPARPADLQDSVDDRLLGVAVRGFAVHPLR